MSARKAKQSAPLEINMGSQDAAPAMEESEHDDNENNTIDPKLDRRHSWKNIINRKQSFSQFLGKKIAVMAHPDDWEVDTVHRLYSHASHVILGLFAWAACVFLFGFTWMLPHGPLWACICLWFTSLFVGKIFERYGIPPLLGQLISGIVLKNLPGNPVEGLTEEWSGKIRAIGLCLILMRSGLEIDMEAVMKQGWVAARLTAMPGISEALAVALAAHLILDMPFTLAISLGFILAAVSPAVVVSGMFDLQKQGYGIDKGIPSLVVAAASCDDVVAISGFSMFIGMAIPTGEDPILAGFHGPINLAAGLIFGILGGLLCGCTKLWNKPYKRTYIILSIGLFYMMVAEHYHYGGGGALAGLVMAVVATHCWHTAYCGHWSLPANNDWNHEVEHDVAHLWGNLAQPLLFGSIGATIFIPDIISGGYIGKAIAIICIGVAVRTPMAALSTVGRDFELKERTFIALSWIPKATVQAALASKPLEMVETYMDPDDKDYHKYEEWGKAVLATAVLSILITAPIGLVSIAKLGPAWLNYTAPTKKGGRPTISGAHDDKWAQREAHLRLKRDDKWVIMNKAAGAYFFCQMQDCISELYEAANHSDRYTGTKEDCKRVAHKLWEGVISVHSTIESMEERFNVAPLYTKIEGESYGHQFSAEQEVRRSLTAADFPEQLGADADGVDVEAVVVHRTNSHTDVLGPDTGHDSDEGEQPTTRKNSFVF